MRAKPLLFVCLLLVGITPAALCQSFTNVQVNPPSTQPFFTNGQTEPAIAQNPLNPQNIVVAAMDFTDTPSCPDAPVVLCRFARVSSAGYYASFDGGLTWPCRGLLPVTALGWPAFDVNLAFDSRGALYYSAMSTDTGGLVDMMVSKSTDGGCTWGWASLANNASPANWAGQSLDFPQMTVDANPASPYRDTIYASWMQYTNSPPDFRSWKLMFTRSTDGGATWSSPNALSSDSNAGLLLRGGQQIRTGPDGTVYVVWFDVDRIGTEILLAISQDGGKTFRGKNTVIARPTDDLSPLPVSVLGSRGITRFTIAPNGNLYVGWSNYLNGHATVMIVKSMDQGQTWTAPAAAADLPGRSALWSAVTADPSGKLNVIFQALDDLPGGMYPGPGTAYYDTYFAQSVDGGATFSVPLRISTAPSDPQSSGYSYFPLEFVGDYNSAVSDSRGGGVFAVWGDMRNAARCAAVDALRWSGGPPVDIITQCPTNFGNGDIYLGKVTY